MKENNSIQPHNPKNLLNALANNKKVDTGHKKSSAANRASENSSCQREVTKDKSNYIARKHQKFFTWVNTPPNTPLNTLTLPAIHINSQNTYLELKRDEYNHKTKVKRIVAFEQGFKVKGVPEFQTIPGNLFNLMQNLAKLARLQMDWNNKHLSAHGLQLYDPANPYTISANSVILANNVGCSPRTIRRLLKRALVVGFLKGTKKNPDGKIFQGKTNDFDLLINPEWLLVFDLFDQEKPAIAHVWGKTVECAFPDDLRTKCPPNVPFKYSDNNSIKDERDLCKSTNESFTADAERNPLKGSPKRCGKNLANPSQFSQNFAPKNFPAGAKSKPGGGGADIPSPKTEVMPAASAQKEVTAATPEKSTIADIIPGTLSDYIFQQAIAIMLFGLKTYWKSSEIYDGAIANAEKYLFQHYFGRCRTVEQVDRRTNYIIKVIQTAADHIDKKPNSRFALVPSVFFDMHRKRPKGDFSGFLGIDKLLREREEYDKIKSQTFEKRMADKAFRQLIHRYEDKPPTPNRALKLVRAVKGKHPTYISALTYYLETGKLPKKL